MLQPLVRRTWAPRGKTPVMYSWDRHDRLSAVAAITVAPKRRRLGLYFDIYPRNITADHIVPFLVWLQRQLRRPLLVILDRLNAHRKAARILAERHPRPFSFAWLPPYAPELNPVEALWNHTKYGDLANYIPEDIHDLEDKAEASISDTRSQPQLLRSFFQYAELPL